MDVIDDFTKQLQAILTFKPKPMTRRPEWGAINFESIEAELNRLYSLCSDLLELPLRELPQNVVPQLASHPRSILERLTQIDAFTLQLPNPGGQRDSFASQFLSETGQLLTGAAPWVAYLAYRRGSVAEQLAELASLVDQSRKALGDAAVWVQTKKNEIETAANATREAAVSAGAAVFSANFTNAASAQRNQAKAWLIAAVSLALLTIVAAGASFYWPGWPNDASMTLANVLPRLATKVVVLSVLFTATVWCGNVCRALLHQAAVNEHRGLSISTLQAFVAASADARTKDAVLLEATRAVFGRAPTGYVTESGEQSSEGVRFFEFGKTIADKT